MTGSAPANAATSPSLSAAFDGSNHAPVSPANHAPAQDPCPDPARHSRFVQRLHRRYADLLPLLGSGAPERSALQAALAALQAGGHDLPAALRILRQLTLERLVQLDCAHQAPLETVTRAMTWLAEVTLDAAWQQVAADLDTLHGAPQTPTGTRAEMWLE